MRIVGPGAPARPCAVEVDAAVERPRPLAPHGGVIGSAGGLLGETVGDGTRLTRPPPRRLLGLDVTEAVPPPALPLEGLFRTRPADARVEAIGTPRVPPLRGTLAVGPPPLGLSRPLVPPSVEGWEAAAPPLLAARLLRVEEGRPAGLGEAVGAALVPRAVAVGVGGAP